MEKPSTSRPDVNPTPGHSPSDNKAATPHGRPAKKIPAKNAGQGASKAISFIIVFCILASLAIMHGGRLFGHKFSKGEVTENVVTTPDGEIINTTEIGKDFMGYGGAVPVKIYITNGRIDSISSLPNNESSEIFSKLSEKGLTKAWDGKTPEEAVGMQVDAVTGATYSSNAYIANVRAGLNYILDNGATASAAPQTGFSLNSLVALIVILCGAVVPLFVRNPRYRLIQQLFNVAVLGFWAGTFLDYAMMLSFFENGPTFTLASITLLILLIVGFIYPLFGKSNYYCAWICPFGSLQELTGRLNKNHKLHLGPRTIRFLDNFRQGLWVVLLVLLYLGVGTSWIDYEIFTGFIVRTASWIVMTVGVLFAILAIFIPRPFCRFVCPTGSILKQV